MRESISIATTRHNVKNGTKGSRTHLFVVKNDINLNDLLFSMRSLDAVIAHPKVWRSYHTADNM